MKQHLFESQLRELNHGDLMTLLSHVTGLEKTYMEEEFDRAIKKDESGALRSFGFDVKIGELIELIYNYTREFPNPITENGMFKIKMNLTNEDEETYTFETEPMLEYCDALFEVLKHLFKENYIK